MKIIDKYDAKEEKKSLSRVAKMYEKTHLDPACQRLGGVSGGSGWTKNEGKAYLESLMQGAVYNTIINADIEECLRYARNEECSESIEYWEKLISEKPSVEFLSIDGNNSASYVHSFIKGNDGLKIQVPDQDRPKELKEFTEDQQEDIKHTEKINVITLRRILISEVADLFRKLNTQTSLNGHERRQARFTPMAEFVRAQANSNDARTMFCGFIYNKAKDLDKRPHEELVAQQLMKIHNNYIGALNKKPLDAFYDNTSEVDSSSTKALSSIMKDLCLMSKSVSPLQRKLKKGAWHNLADLIHTVHSLNYSIQNHKKFFEWFLEQDAHFNTQAESVMQKDLDEKSYVQWTTFYNHEKHYTKTQDLFKGAFLASNLESEGVVKIRRTSADNFTFLQKLQAWKLQNGKSRNGEELSIVDLYLGKLEGDHMKSFADGGTTDISNCEVMSRADNRAKGSNSNEPYFPHQQ